MLLPGASAVRVEGGLRSRWTGVVLAGVGIVAALLYFVGLAAGFPAVRLPAKPLPKGLFDRLGQVVHILYEKIVLGAGPCNSDDVRFLERIVTDQQRGDLPGKHHDGNGVHGRGGYAGDGISCPRSGGDENDTRLSGCPCIAVCGMDRTLFMPGEYELQVLFIMQEVKYIEYDAPGVPKHVFYAFLFKAFYEYLGS